MLLQRHGPKLLPRLRVTTAVRACGASSAGSAHTTQSSAAGGATSRSPARRAPRAPRRPATCASNAGRQQYARPRASPLRAVTTAHRACCRRSRARHVTMHTARICLRGRSPQDVLQHGLWQVRQADDCVLRVLLDLHFKALSCAILRENTALHVMRTWQLHNDQCLTTPPQFCDRCCGHGFDRVFSGVSEANTHVGAHVCTAPPPSTPARARRLCTAHAARLRRLAAAARRLSRRTLPQAAHAAAPAGPGAMPHTTRCRWSASVVSTSANPAARIAPSRS